MLLRALTTSVLLMAMGPVSAHKPSDAFMTIEPLSIRFSVALKDLDAAIETLDENQDRQLTFAEFKAAKNVIETLVQKSVGVQCDGKPLNLRWLVDESAQTTALEKRNDGTYARLAAEISCDGRYAIEMQYRLFETIDTSHRLIVTNSLTTLEVLQVASPSEKFVQLRVGSGHNSGGSKMWLSETSIFATVRKFVIEGFTHLAIGWDHLAFILVLVLPFNLWIVKQKKVILNWVNLKQLLFVISAFTVGHCITLVLATFNLVQATGQWVEPTIALTIVVSAALNLMPEVKMPRKWIALLFGTVHGLGFSSVLNELDVSATSRLAALIGFNFGIEFGQIFFVALWAFAQHWLVRWSGYTRWVVTGGSLILMLAAVFLVIIRASA
jgi:HupE / UreJ protein